MHYIALAISALLVLIDQLSKLCVIKYVQPKGVVPIISVNGKDWLVFNYQENTGAAFSILQGKQTFLIIVTSIVILFLIAVILIKRINKPFILTCLALIIAGGLGNWIDRVFRNYVVDFIDVRLISFAVFNFADCCAVIGSVMLFIYMLRDDIITMKNDKKAEAEKVVNPSMATDVNVFEISEEIVKAEEHE